jgi:hypothetical protein
MLALAGSVMAGDGRFEIDIDCVATGCFSGDTGGFPVTIANPGSYVLTSNLDGMAMMANQAISITSSRVSLDLNGFLVSATSPMGLGAIAISASGVEVKNGAVTGLGGGVTSSSGGQLRLANLYISGCAGPAIQLDMGVDNQVVDSVVTGNSTGIVVTGDRAKVTGNVASANSATDGIRTGIRSLVTDNVAAGNGNDGIEVGSASLVRGNVAAGNGSFGINLDSQTLVIANSVTSNAAGNIEACATCTLVDNHAP